MSDRIPRLPFYFDLAESDVVKIVGLILVFLG